jgi:hypothetical protein
MTYSEDFTFKAARSAIVNRLMNGNFFSLPRQYTGEDHQDILGDGSLKGITRIYRTLHKYDERKGTQISILTKGVIPGFFVPNEVPPENYIGYWDVWGADGIVTFDENGKSLDGGHRVDVGITDGGVVNFRQKIESFHKFLGKPVSLALSGYQRSGDVKVWMEVDCGTKVLQTRPFFARYFGVYQRMIDVIDEIPLDATKFEVYIKMEGGKNTSVGISGAVLALGAYTVDLPYSDNPSDKVMPHGSVIMFEGDT